MLEDVENKENVCIDLCFNMSEQIEKIDYDKISEVDLLQKFNDGVHTIEDLGFKVNTQVVGKDVFYFHKYSIFPMENWL